MYTALSVVTKILKRVLGKDDLCIFAPDPYETVFMDILCSTYRKDEDDFKI